jgi:hypothetical protein
VDQTQKHIHLISEHGIKLENAINANACVTINTQDIITQQADITTNNSYIVLAVSNERSLTTINAGNIKKIIPSAAKVMMSLYTKSY